jgi:hypothetical protein
MAATCPDVPAFVGQDVSQSALVRGAAQKAVLVRPDLQVHLDAVGRNGRLLRLRRQKTTVGWVGRDAAREFDYPVLCRGPVHDCPSASDAKEPADVRPRQRAPLRMAARRKAAIRAGRFAVAARLADVVRERAARCSVLPLVRQEQRRVRTDEWASAPDGPQQERLESLSAKLQPALVLEWQVPLLAPSRALTERAS